MKQLQFSCTLLSDVVLSSQAATEGFHESLDYIPGAKFLGIAASSGLYNMENQQQTLDIFHNGCVRFGDAHPLTGEDQNAITYKVPASWQYIKGENLKGEIFLSHELTKEKKVALLDDGKQLKQAQKGYFTTSDQLLEVEQNFSIKSAYDSKEYRAKDQLMYGYFALKKGTKWYFEITTDKAEYSDLIIKAVQGKKRMGRSGSAEYGLVDIALLNESTPGFEATIIGVADHLYLYAASNLCFYNDFGATTLQPNPVKHLLLPENSQILWEKSQVRARKYLTWNKHRNNRDADRLIIEKGSVIAVKLSKNINTSIFEKGIGAHRSEGFGRVLANPDFLKGKDEKVQLNLRQANVETFDTNFFAVEKRSSDDLVISFLSRKLEEIKQETEVDKKVNEFLKNSRDKFKEITSSQWGQVRIIAKHAQKSDCLRKLLFDKDFGLCMTGQSEPRWRGCRKILEEFIFSASGLNPNLASDLTMKIAAEMAKATQNKERHGKTD